MWQFMILATSDSFISLPDFHFKTTHRNRNLAPKAYDVLQRLQKQEKLERRSVIARYLGLFSFLPMSAIVLENVVVSYNPVSRALLISTMDAESKQQFLNVITRYLGLFSFLHSPSKSLNLCALSKAEMQVFF